MELPITIEPDDVRSSDRVVPGRPVTIWLEHGRDPMARGVVANISQGGACVWARVPLEVGEEIAMRLSFLTDQLLEVIKRSFLSPSRQGQQDA